MDKLTELFRANGVPLPVSLPKIVGKTVSGVRHNENKLFLFFTDGTAVPVVFDKRLVTWYSTLGEWALDYMDAVENLLTATEADNERFLRAEAGVTHLLDERVEELERIEYARLKAKYGG